MSETIVVTGAAGFIGSTLIEQLLQQGYNVVGIDRVRRPVKLGELVESIDYVVADITNGHAIANIIEKNKPIGIIHLAAVSRVVWCEHDIYRCIDVNINGTISIIKSLITSNSSPWLIYGSSREVYGEPQRLPVKESDPKKPINTYGYTKLLSEKIVSEFSRRHMVPAIILRFSNVYGNEKDILDRVIPRLIIRALKGLPLEIHGGSQVFDFTYIDDTVNGIMHAVEKLMEKDYWFNSYHILTGKPTPLHMLPIYISKILGREVNVVYKSPRRYDVMRFYGDPSKAEVGLGFKARVFVEEGIRRTIERFKAMLK